MARKQFETLTEQMYYILLALNEPRHGYAVMQYVSELTSGRVSIGAGTLYTLLSRFNEERYVSMREEGDRKTYELTDEGRRLIDRERARLYSVLKDSNAVLGETNNSEYGNTKPADPNGGVLK